MLRRFIATLVRLWRGRRGQVPPTTIVIDSVTAFAARMIEEEVARTCVGTTPIRPTESSSTLTEEMLTDTYNQAMAGVRRSRDGYRAIYWGNMDYLRGVRHVQWTHLDRTIREVEFEALRTRAERVFAGDMVYYQHPQRLGVITSIDEPATTCKCKRHNPMKQKELFA